MPGVRESWLWLTRLFHIRLLRASWLQRSAPTRLFDLADLGVQVSIHLTAKLFDLLA
jgi:hypothetical protein